MKFEKIVGFGDSWIYGDELMDPVLTALDPELNFWSHPNRAYRESHCFLGQLGKHYGVPVVNFGLPGGSLQSTIWTFLWWLERETDPSRCLVLIGLTNPDRFSHYDPVQRTDQAWDKFVHSTWVQAGCSAVPEDFRELCRLQLALTACAELNHYNYMQATLLFDGVGNRLQLPLIQFNVMDPQCRSGIVIPSLIWPSQNLCHWFIKKPEYKKSGGHPNEQGHEIIRDMLIPEIDRVTINA